MTDIPEAKQAEAIRSYAVADRSHRYDLSKDLLIRLAVLHTQKDAYTLLLSFHHIIMDGWCLGIVMDELFAAYEALKAGKPVELPTPQPYTGYARWLDKQDKEAAKEYWRSILNGYDQPAVLPTLPVAHPLQAATGYLLHEHKITLTDETTCQLRTVAERNGTTLSSLFLAAWESCLEDTTKVKTLSSAPLFPVDHRSLKVWNRCWDFSLTPYRYESNWMQISHFRSACEVQRSAVQSRAYDYFHSLKSSPVSAQAATHGSFVVFENIRWRIWLAGRIEGTLGFVVEDAHCPKKHLTPSTSKWRTEKR
ncbi:condensation domain-containing protein [Paenibacillus sp. IHB B 3084]|uniref:condensation domain-containing protein n=1 Tax=Paenibacillus sp. IHB B 3084 TaxID=867076 RepID=UPI000ABF0D53